MVNIIKRMRHLREVLTLDTDRARCSDPSERGYQDYIGISQADRRGHNGAKRFWRDMLPKIKYRNPSIPIQIKRHADPSGPATMHIYTKASTTSTSTSTSETTTASSSSSSPTPAHSVDIKNMPSDEILAQLVSRTSAEELQPTEQEQEELKEIEEFKKRSEADRVMVRERLLNEREEERLLKLARGEIADQK